MASVNFEKLKGAAETKAMLRHCDKEERLKHEHSNKEINKSDTHFNQQLKLNYKQSCEYYDKRIDELDSTTNTNKRKDRVTCMGLSIPFPEGMDDKQGVKWCNECFRIIGEMYGRSNVVQTYIHFDEKHEYTNAEDKKVTSRSHMHAYIIPELEGKLNAKECMSRKRMIELNSRIHQMTKSEYGLQFMDGSKTKSEESVTALKNKSRQRELKAQEVELKKRREQLDRQQAELIKREEALRRSESHFKSESDKMLEEMSSVLERANNRLTELENTKAYVHKTYGSDAWQSLNRQAGAVKQKLEVIKGQQKELPQKVADMMKDYEEQKKAEHNNQFGF